MSRRATRTLLVMAIAFAGPFAFGFDLLARLIIFRDQPDEVRQFFSEHATRLAWLTVPLPLLGGIVGFVLYPRLLRRARAHLGENGSTETPDRWERADFKALLIATTMAQLPALLGDVSVMMGARLTPAICCTGISIVAVLLIGLVAR